MQRPGDIWFAKQLIPHPTKSSSFSILHLLQITTLITNFPSQPTSNGENEYIKHCLPSTIIKEIVKDAQGLFSSSLPCYSTKY